MVGGAVSRLGLILGVQLLTYDLVICGSGTSKASA
jgi:hypothetical protein